MAWFRNHYVCARCGSTWQDEWSAMCEDDCPECGARHMSPLTSDDLTFVIEPDGSEYSLFRSPKTADDDPKYRILGRFRTRREARSFLSSRRTAQRRSKHLQSGA